MLERYLVGAALTLALAALVLWRRREAVQSPASPWKKKRKQHKAPPAPRQPRARAEVLDARELLEGRWDVFDAAQTGAVRFATFNVLADAYAYGQRHCPRRTLDWEARFPQLVEAVRRFDADVISLQEADHVEEWISALAGIGYACAHVRRDADAAFSPPDTAIVAWRAVSFTLVNEERVSYDALVQDGDKRAKRFQRHNVALLVRLRRSDGLDFVVANSHLYWDPARGDVKLAQMDCLLRRTEAFALDAGVGRVIVCGDFNSLPQSRAMRLCLDGAARLEPHYAADVPRRPAGAGGHSLVIVDNNLAKICKWLRLVGVDAELETAEEAQARAAGGAIALVARAKAGGRLLVTSSRTLVARRECAALPCAFIPSMMDADAAFAHVICAAQIDVDGSRALSRCVLCNGAIRVLGAAAAAAARVGAAVPQDAATALSECSGCGQRFWFNDDGDSSAARAQQLADRLVRVAIQARADAGAAADDGSDALLRGLAAGARHGLGLRSAHPVGGGVSNYCPDFHGQLDYVLYSRATWALARRRRLPTTAELRAALRGAFLPTCEWPSDHVAVVVDLAPTEAPTESTDAAALGDARQCES